MDFDIKNILEIVKKKNRIPRFILMCVGIFLLSFNFNLLILPNNIVLGGVSGIGTILKGLLGWDAAVIILVLNVVLLIVSYFFLGKDKTAKTVVGSILYPLFIPLSTPLVKLIEPQLNFNSFIIPLIVTIFVYGISNAMIYKSGYTTGGSDVIMQIINKYKNVPTGQASFITSIIFMTAGGFIFGIDKFIYGIIINYASSLIIDRLLIGVSANKMFFIYSSKIDDVSQHILNNMKTGMTSFKIQGGYTQEKGNMAMCVINTRDYYKFKNTVLNIDPDAFFVISDCYEVKGGMKRKQLIIP